MTDLSLRFATWIRVSIIQVCVCVCMCSWVFCVDGFLMFCQGFHGIQRGFSHNLGLRRSPLVYDMRSQPFKKSLEPASNQHECYGSKYLEIATCRYWFPKNIVRHPTPKMLLQMALFSKTTTFFFQDEKGSW